jgi:hypothetical protein
MASMNNDFNCVYLQSPIWAFFEPFSHFVRLKTLVNTAFHIIMLFQPHDIARIFVSSIESINTAPFTNQFHPIILKISLQPIT